MRKKIACLEVFFAARLFSRRAVLSGPVLVECLSLEIGCCGSHLITVSMNTKHFKNLLPKQHQVYKTQVALPVFFLSLGHPRRDKALPDKLRWSGLVGI